MGIDEDMIIRGMRKCLGLDKVDVLKDKLTKLTKLWIDLQNDSRFWWSVVTVSIVSFWGSLYMVFVP